MIIHMIGRERRLRDIFGKNNQNQCALLFVQRLGPQSDEQMAWTDYECYFPIVSERNGRLRNSRYERSIVGENGKKLSSWPYQVSRTLIAIGPNRLNSYGRLFKKLRWTISAKYDIDGNFLANDATSPELGWVQKAKSKQVYSAANFANDLVECLRTFQTR